jgi:hypothetical protein
MHIWFVEPNPHHNNFGIMAEGSVEEIQMIDRLAYRDFVARWLNDPQYNEKKSWGAFHQGSTSDWTYWEFWADQTVEFRQKVMDKITSFQEEMVKIASLQNEMDEI